MPTRLGRYLGAHFHRAGRALLWVVLGAVVVFGSIALSLTVTPYSTVSAAGQSVSVGAASPSLSLSGPGQLDLFGQQLPTTLQFAGPIRPRLVLERITVDSQVSSLFRGPGAGGVERSLGRALEAGLKRYFVWEAALAGACALVLIGAIAGWLRLPWRRVLVLLVAGLLVVEAVDLGAIALAVDGAPARLSRIGSLEALVGRVRLDLPPPAAAPAPPAARAVVLGDSTAAGLGNPLLPDPTAADRACSRSADSYASDLAAVNGWKVLNLSCSGATVGSGILGPQQVGSLTLPPQLSVAEQVRGLKVVIVSIGANDVGWSGMLEACAAAASCANSAFAAYFQQQLANFSTSYLALLQQLAALPGHPRVVINLYYDPFDPARHCLARVGMNPSKERTVVALLDALNNVLATGARSSSFLAVQPSFAGHGLCDLEPYVQGLRSAAPFHPTAAGELAIALADEQALLATPASTGSGNLKSS